jgi:hypothetical protein
MISPHDQEVRGEPIHTKSGGAHALGKLLPCFVHHQRGTDDAWKTHHIVVGGHAEID